MELILVFVLGVPLGLILPSRKIAFAVLMTAFLIVLPFQTISVGNAGPIDWSYWVVQVVIAALGAGLVALGARWRAKRNLSKMPEASTN